MAKKISLLPLKTTLFNNDNIVVSNTTNTYRMIANSFMVSANIKDATTLGKSLIVISNSHNLRLAITNGIPSSNPHVAGALYSNNGVVMISSG